MSYVKIWVHLVFSTKNRIPFLSDKIRPVFYKHIMKNCRDKNIFLQTVNGYTEHIHCLISLGKDQSIAQVARLIKGESSFWFNKNQIKPVKFEWQDDYFAVSVSESHVESVIKYIDAQETHHTKQSFNDEIHDLLTIYGFKIVKD
ncbi:MAG: IS200/IS605 family transposase [Bacteroidota bacterium]|nr:IS200/IS605 family transposase [Bacteroidota bacterium]